jgi:uncharacterized protein
MSDLEITLHNESLSLMPERAVYWSRTRTLFIADAHFGKSATFRAYGVPVPEGSLEADLQRLSHAITRTGADKLIVLGDLLHAAKGRDAITLDTVQHWREQHAALEMILIRGNHDDRAGDPPPEWDIRCVNGATPGPVFVLNHTPIAPTHGYALCGHLHPAALLTGNGRDQLKLPCFWVRKQHMVLPAFGSFIDHAIVRPTQGDRMYVTTDTAVIAV